MKALNAMIENLTLRLKGMRSHGKFLREAVSGFSLCFRKLTLGVMLKTDWGGRHGGMEEPLGETKAVPGARLGSPPACGGPEPLPILPHPPAKPVVSEPSSGAVGRAGLAKLTLTNHSPHPGAALTVWSPWRHGNLRPLVNGSSTRLQQWGRA